MEILFAVLTLGIGNGFAFPVDDFEHLAMENPDLFGGDILGLEPGKDKNAVANITLLWPGGVIPYTEDAGIKHTITSLLIEKAMGHYKRNTCIRFVPRTNEKDYIRFFAGEGCYSFIGRVGGPQIVSLGKGCDFVGTIIHELGHAVGFYHEQNRSDRDDWLVIYWDNILRGEEAQFFKLSPDQNQLLTPFDYNSIMLYGSFTFSRDRKKGLRTMEGENNMYLKDVNSKKELSENDIKRINLMYNCN